MIDNRSIRNLSKRFQIDIHDDNTKKLFTLLTMTKLTSKSNKKIVGNHNDNRKISFEKNQINN